jgi:hypothetical protein
VAYLGLSFGAIWPVAVLRLVPEIKTAILLADGNWLGSSEESSFVHRLTLPILVLKGRYDCLLPFAMAQRFFDTAGGQTIRDLRCWPLATAEESGCARNRRLARSVSNRRGWPNRASVRVFNCDRP